MPMQPRPMAETSRPLLPSARLFIVGISWWSGPGVLPRGRWLSGARWTSGARPSAQPPSAPPEWSPVDGGAGQTVIVLVLTEAEVRAVLDLDAVRIAVAGAMREVTAGRTSMPARIAAVVPGQGLLAAMPAYLPGDGGGLAAKLVSLFPGNAGTELPTHQAVIMVFDPDTGRPVALLDGTAITTARTAAGSALSADLLARPDAVTLAILGTGVQARAHAEALVRVRPIERIRVAGRDRDKVSSLAAELRAGLAVEVDAADSYAEACAGADIVCAATHSPTPVVRRQFLGPGVHVTSVGFNTAGREVDSATVADAVVVVESRHAALAPPPAGSN